MNSKISVRPAFFDDEQEIVEIMNHAISEKRNAYTKEYDWIQGSAWFKELKDASTSVLVACIHDQVVGWGNLSLYRGGRTAFSNVREISFYVHKNFRGQGVATRIIAALEDEAIVFGLKHLVALLLDDNLPSRKLLEKHQYFVWGLFEGLAEFEDLNRGHLYMGKQLRSE